MIPVHEIRVGNYVYDAAGDIGRIIRVNDSFVVQTPNRGHVSIGECSGIELTPSLLKELGFKKDHLFLYPGDADTEIRYLHQLQNWNPGARKDLKDMLIAGNSLKLKLQKLGFDMGDLPPYLEGDKDDFLTKES